VVLYILLCIANHSGCDVLLIWDLFDRCSNGSTQPSRLGLCLCPLPPSCTRPPDSANSRVCWFTAVSRWFRAFPIAFCISTRIYRSMCWSCSEAWVM
jgi:hypothetical protein